MGSAEEVPTPGYVRAKQNSAGKSERLGEQGSRWGRRVAAGGNYMSLDRPDVAFACKETCHGMSQPTVVEEERLERLGKYLKSHPSIVQRFVWRSQDAPLKVMTDADWAGCQRSRKSTSGGVVLKGYQCCKSWAKTQPSIGPSSGENELVSLVRGCCEALGVKAVMADLGSALGQIEALTDATAGIGMAHREGVGRTIHLDGGLLWIQQREEQEELKSEGPKQLR